MSVYMLDYVHNQLYKEPDAGKPHVRILRGVSPVRGLSTRQTYKTLEEILGHSNLSTTMDVYAHVLPDTKASELQKLADLFY